MVRVRLNHHGVGEVLRSAGVRAVVEAAGEAVAAAARSQGRTTSDGSPLPVQVRVVPALPSGSISDRRPVAQVTITHPAGLGMQAKHGVLTRAAAAVGLEVTDRE